MSHRSVAILVVLVLAAITSTCGGGQRSREPMNQTQPEEGEESSHSTTVEPTESSGSAQSTSIEPDTATQGERPEAWEQGYGIVCTTQAHTVGEAGECGPEPEFAFISDALSPLPCGPCGFSLNAEATSQARAEVRPDACCYSAFSPPPPP